MLTREQKIDFLKRCIAAYEDERVQERIDSYRLGFCEMFGRYVNCYVSVETARLRDGFSKFYKYVDKNRAHGFVFDWLYMYPLNTDGALQRAKVARQFLKQEYGITVPPKKTKKAKQIYPFTCPMQ